MMKKVLEPHGAQHPSRDGTQVLRRAAAMLREVAQAGSAGASLADVARTQQLARSTAHRILQCLVDEELLEQESTDKRYRVGRLLHELGMATGASAAQIARWRPVVEAVARRSGVTAYLMRRSGVEAVCLVKVDGQGALRFVPVEVGQRRLLGVGAGATALLAALRPDQIAEVIAVVSPGLHGYPRIDAASLEAAVQAVQRTGFAISHGRVVEHGFGMGAIVADGTATPQLALSIAAHASEVTESAIVHWKAILREEIDGAQAPG